MSKNRKFEVPVTVQFACTVIVVAENKFEARAIVNDNFWMHGDTSRKGYDERIVDWEVPTISGDVRFHHITLKDH